jgi:hypothetical protein
MYEMHPTLFLKSECDRKSRQKRKYINKSALALYLQPAHSSFKLLCNPLLSPTQAWWNSRCWVGPARQASTWATCVRTCPRAAVTWTPAVSWSCPRARGLALIPPPCGTLLPATCSTSSLIGGLCPHPTKQNVLVRVFHEASLANPKMPRICPYKMRPIAHKASCRDPLPPSVTPQPPRNMRWRREEN